jgi:plasmid stabilization system protein ParE
MKVVLSARVEADIARQLEYGVSRFGPAVAARTFARVETFLFERLAAQPYAGKYIQERGIYEAWIVKTPFVIFYRVNAESEIVTVLALFHHAQDRSAFGAED